MIRFCAGLVLYLTLAAEVAGAPDTLWVAPGIAAAGDTLVAAVYLNNARPVAGMRWTVEFDAHALAFVDFEPGGRLAGMETFVHALEGRAQAIVIDAGTAAGLPAGTDRIGRFRFTVDESADPGEYEIRVVDVELVDNQSPPARVPSVGIAGRAVVTAFAMSAGTARGAAGDTVVVEASLSSPGPVAGLQTRLAWPPGFLEFVDVSASGRAVRMGAYASHPGDGSVKLLLADLSGTDPLPGGRGEVLRVRFRIGGGNLSGEIPVRLEDVRLSDADGRPLPVVAYPGVLEIYARPNRPPVAHLPEVVYAYEDSLFEWAVPAADPDGDDLIVAADGMPAWLRLDGPSGRMQGVPADVDVGRYPLRIFLSDGEFRPEFQTVLEVVNRPPEIGGTPPDRGRAGSLWRYAPEVRNLDGGPVFLDDPVPGAVVEEGTGVLVWRPESAGVLGLTLVAADPHGARAVQRFNVVVEPRPQVQIVEVLADPPSGPAGDANGDGIRDSQEDEFVELLNAGPDPVVLGGWLLCDDDVGAEHGFRFPDGTVLLPGERAVVFGGGSPRDVPGPVFVDDGTIGNGLTNSSDVILLIDPALDDTVARVEYRVAGDLNESLFWNGTEWQAHGAGEGFGPFSPGTERVKVVVDTEEEPSDTSGVPEEEVPDTPEPVAAPPAPRPDGVRINEVHADPASGEAGDTNGDGRREGYEDEFVELWNAGADSADLSGWRMGDDDTALERLFVFPEGTKLAPGGFLTVFGGGEPAGVPGLWFVDDGRIGDGLSNAGDAVVLISPDGGDTLDVAQYAGARKGISLVRDGAQWVFHDLLPRKEPFSPGRAGARLQRLSVFPERVDLAEGEHIQMIATGWFDDGSDEAVTDRVSWYSEDESVAQVQDGLVRSVREGRTEIRAMLNGYGDAIASVSVMKPVKEDSAGADGEQEIPAEEDSTETQNGGNEPIENRTPVFVSLPDTVAFAGVGYRYRVRVEDPDGDGVYLRTTERPAWLGFDGETLEGIPSDLEVGRWSVALELSDGENTVSQRFGIQVVRELFLEIPDTTAVAGQTWRARLRPDHPFEIQVDGGPKLEPNPPALAWRPETGDEGLRWIHLSVSGPGVEQAVRTLGIHVLPAPALKISEVLVSLSQGVDVARQFIELLNAGPRPVDLSGWTLGDDDGEPFRFPRNTVLLPGDRLTVQGGGAADPDGGLYVAGGRIGNGLAASDRLLLVSPSGPDTVLDVRYSGARPGTSLVPDPEQPDRWVPHTKISERPFSPGAPETAPGEVREEPAGTEEGEPVAVREPGGREEAWALPAPNPFNAQTTFGFRSAGGRVRVTVYSALGQPVRTLYAGGMSAGIQKARWDGRDDQGRPAATGVYLIEIDTGVEVRCGRVLLLR